MATNRVHCTEFIGVATNSTHVLPIRSSGVTTNSTCVTHEELFVCLVTVAPRSLTRDGNGEVQFVFIVLELRVYYNDKCTSDSTTISGTMIK